MLVYRFVLILNLILALPLIASAQNLAPNPNFISYSGCPTNTVFSVDSWTAPINLPSTPDYFNVCAPSGTLGVPFNFVGFQNSGTGAYIGFASGEPNPSGSTLREFAQAQLTQPTVPGCYELTFIYSNADYGAYCNGLGLLLSNGLPPTYVGQLAQLEVATIIQDSLNWLTQTGTYVSPGGETHITLGNFRENTDLTFIPTSGNFGAFASYSLIDYVSVKYIGPTCQTTNCLANAGVTSIVSSPSCPSTAIDFTVNGYNNAANFTQYILISNDQGTIVDMTVGDVFSFNHSQCASFTVHSYNIENTGSQTVPAIGQHISTLSCLAQCCEMISEAFSFEDNVTPNFYSLQDNPNFPANGPFTEIYCVDDIPALEPGLYSDLCIGQGSVIGSEANQSSPCNGGNFIRTWEVSDSCNTTTAQHIIVIEPVPLPFPINPPADKTISCDSIPFDDPVLLFSNDLNNSCELSYNVTANRADNYDACGGFIEFVWANMDACGRNFNYTQNIEILAAPIASYLNPISQITVTCDVVDTISKLLDYSNGLSGFCNIEGTSIADLSGNYDACGGQLFYNWSFMDDCGRSIDHTLEIIVEATTPPTLDATPIDLTLDCSVTNFVPEVLNYTNSSSGSCLIEGPITPTMSNTGNQILVTWVEQLPCGLSVSEMQTVTIQPGPDISLDQDTVTICIDGSFDLSTLVITDANNTGASMTYHSDLPPAVTNELITTMVAPTATTDYYIAASINGNCLDVDTLTLIVSPPMYLIESGSGLVCKDSSFYNLFDYLAFANYFSGSWTDLDGAGVDLTDPLNVQFNNVPFGEYDFSYQVPSDGICPGDSATATITVAPLPELMITSTDCAIDLNSYSITITTIDNPIITISHGVLNNLNLNSFEISTIPVNETLTLNIQDPLSLCQIQTDIIPPDCNCPVVSLPINDGDIISCVEDLPIILSVTLGPDQGASWYDQAMGGTLLIANSNTYQPNINIPGTYTFYVESFDLVNTVCKSETRTPVTLTILDPPVVTDIQTAVCQDADGINTTFFLQNSNDQISPNPTYSFSYHLSYNQAVDNASPIADPFVITGIVDQIVYARVIDTNGCYAIAEVTLSVLLLPTISLNTSELSCPGIMDGVLEITVLTAQGNITTSLNGAAFNANLIYNNLDTGLYTLSIQDSLMCTNDYTFNILSNNEIYVDEYSLVCNDNGTINDPTDDFYTLKFNLSTDGNGTMFNLTADLIDLGQFNYNLDQSIILPADGNTHTLRFLDSSTGCDKTITTIAFLPCSDPCVVYPSSSIFVDPSNILDCSVTAINLSSMNETNTTYLWAFNNSPLNDLTIDQEGQVILIAIDTISGCQSVDTLNILNLEEYPLVNLDLSDTISCDMPMVEIDASLSQSGGQFEYNWYFEGLLINEFSNQNLVNASAGGWYILEIIDTNLGCINEDSIFVEEITSGWNISLIPELTFDLGDNTLNATTSLTDDLISSISWTPSENLSCNDCLNPTILAPGTNQYTLVITDIFGCVETASIEIRYEEKEIYVPNGFSPNGDGINDYFELGIPTDYQLAQLEMWIFNRWGELIYYQDNLHTAPSTSFWNGRYKNTWLNPAVFVYYIEATTSDNEQISFQGDLTLTR